MKSISAVLLWAFLALVNGAILGGWETTDESDPVDEVVEVAQNSLNAMRNSMFLYKVTKVHQSRKQLEGTNWRYNLDFTMGRTKCYKGLNAVDIKTCDASDGPHERCSATVVYQADGMKYLDQSFTCNRINKRSDGEVGKPVADPETYKHLVERAAAEMNAELNEVTMLSVRKQVVQGVIYYMKVQAKNSVGEVTVCNVDIWERTWLPDGFEVERFECDKDVQITRKGTRALGGGISTVDDPSVYLSTAKHALGMSNAALTNIKVISATTQVVSGQMLRLKIEGNNLDGKKTTCNIHVWTQPWLADPSKVTYFDCDQEVSITKDTRALRGCAGCVSKIDDPMAYLGTAKLALGMSNAALKNIKVISATTQVVSGQMIRMKIEGDNLDGKKTTCDINVWSRPWLDDEPSKVTRFECDQDVSVKRGTRALRGCAGCVSKINDPMAYLGTAKLALGMSNAALTNIKVISATTQVVSGQMIRMKIEGDNLDGKKTTCDINVWSRPWLDDEPSKVTRFECDQDVTVKKDTRALRGCAGCVSKIDDPMAYLGTAKLALGMSNAALKNIKVISATTQVVSGQMIRMKIEGDNLEGKKTTCDINVWSRPWLDDEPSKVTRFECDQDVSSKIKSTRALERRAGGISKVANPSIYLDTAKMAIGASNAALENIKVISATTQVVSGQMIRMKIEGDNLDGKKTVCDISVWNQPWIKKDPSRVTHFQCDQDVSSKSINTRAMSGFIAGGIHEVDDLSQYQKEAEAAIAETNSELKNVKVLSASTQVVSGQLIRMKVQGELNNGTMTTCDITVWKQAWLNSSKVTHFQCA